MKKYLPMLVTAIVIGGAAFYGGLQYGKSQSLAAAGAGGSGRGGNFAGRQRGGNGGNFIGGQIVGKDDKSITVQSMDGSSKIIFFSDTTKIMKAVDGTLADLAAGKQVSINGTQNPDGSITAQSIQLRTAMPRPPQDTTPNNQNQAK